MENFEQKYEKIFPPIYDGSWTHEVIKSTPELLVIRQTLELGEKKIEEIGTYTKIHLEELKQDFFILDEKESTSGCLPHGTACYLAEWDVILVRTGPHGLDLREPLSVQSFTVLAHELGHRFDYLETDANDMENLPYGEKEIRAWQIAKQRLGDNPKFDHGYADKDMKSYRKN